MCLLQTTRTSLPLHEPPSLSKSGLLLSPCIAWAGPLSRWYDEEKVDLEDMSKRDKGTCFHRAIDDFLKTGCPEAALPQDVAKWLDHAIKYMKEVLGPRCESIQSEVAISVNWVERKAEVLVGVKDRNYPKREGWQNGTADLVCILKDGSLLIADWKTGGADGAKEQLLSLGVGFQFCMVDDNSYREPRKLVTLCLQVNDEGVWPHEYNHTLEEIESHWDSMRFQWEDIGVRNTPVSGIHCTTLYCPHLAYCSAITDGTVELAEQEGRKAGTLMPAESLVRSNRLNDTPLSDEEAGSTMSLVSASKRQVKYVEEKLKDYVAAGGKVTAGGYTWGPGSNGWRWRKSA